MLVLRDLGERAQALEWLDRCERESERVGLGFVARDCQLQRALLLAQAGELSRAELELSRAGHQRGTGWRGVHRPQAEARGGEPARRLRPRRSPPRSARSRASPRAPSCFRVWAAVDMAPLLAANGAPELARDAIATTLATLDERCSRASAAACTAPGCWRRARACSSTRASLGGRLRERARAASTRPGEAAIRSCARTGPGMRPVLWHALAEQAVTADAVLPAMQQRAAGRRGARRDGRPPGRRGPPRRAVGRARGGPPRGARPAGAARQGRRRTGGAAAAAATAERLRTDSPPLRFELLGGFRVLRAGWELDEAAWTRPMAARVVRFLLTAGAQRRPGGRAVRGVLVRPPGRHARASTWPSRSRARARCSTCRAPSRA